jgi:predicted lipoprotein with Yx(FWY)xxD motif
MKRGLIRIVLPLVLVAAAGAGAAMVATTASAGAKATVKTVKNGTFGVVLVDGSGKALYRYTPDRKGKSVCTGQCLTYWPALVIKASAKPVAGAGVKASLLGSIKAKNGMRQVTYGGWPLYHYKADAKAGQFEGQGEDGTWYVVNAKGALVKKPASSGGGGGGGGGGGYPPEPTTTSGTTTDDGGGAWG